MKTACARAEIVAGAIALGEVTDSERDEYRRHIAGCSPCLRALGGEREIERVMGVVRAAHASETWEPVVASVSAARRRTKRFAWRLGLSTAALAIAASFGIHLAIATSVRPLAQPVPEPARVANAETMHVTLEHRAPATQNTPKPMHAVPRILVVHNVITLKAPERDGPKRAPRSTQTTTTTTTTTTVVAEASSAPAPSVPIWRRDESLPSASVQTKTQTASTPILQGRAESIAIAPSYIVRDVMPLGGETAINPQPPLIAYSQGAEGTTAFEVSVDDRGNPQRCTITKSSGYLSLDNAVCAAAMKARYAPRLVNGRATTGIYRDAFTFRAQTNNNGIQP